MSRLDSNKLFALGVLVLMAVAAGASLLATRASEGILGDAVSYLGEARSWAATGTMTVPDFSTGGVQPTDHWPPLYPLLIAGFGYFTGDALSGARWLNAIVFALNIALIAFLGRRVTQSAWGGLACAFIFACAPAALLVHVNVMSEAPCLALSLLSVVFLLRYQETNGSPALAASAVAAGLAILTRYAAVSLVPVAVGFALFFGRQSIRRRILSALAYTTIALLPTIVYVAHQRMAMTPLAHTTTLASSRGLGFYGLTSTQLLYSVRSLEEWLCPIANSPLFVRFVLFALFGTGIATMVAMATLTKEKSTTWLSRREPAGLLLANFAAYFALLLFSGLFYDPSLDLSNRMFLPAFAYGLLLIGASWPLARQKILAQPRGAVFAGTSLCFLLLLSVYLLGAAQWLRQVDESNLGQAGARWRNLPSVPLIKQLRADAPVYTNVVKFVYCITGRTSVILLPVMHHDDARRTTNSKYAEEVARLAADVAARSGTIIFFKGDTPTFNSGVSLEELKANSGLRLSAETADAVFFVPAAPAHP